MDCLKFHHFFNNLMGLPVVTENETCRRSKKLLRTFYQRFTELIVFLGVTGQLLAIPSVWVDMNVLCGCLASCTHAVQVLLKTVYLNVYQEDFTQYLTSIALVQRYSEDFEERYLRRNGAYMDYYLKESKYVRLMLASHFAITILSTSAYFLPFVYDSIVHYYNVENQLTPIVVYLPVNFNWTPLFQIVVLLLTVCFYLNNLKTVVIDNFMLGLIVLSMSHFRYQKELLKCSLREYWRGAETTESANRDIETYRKSVIREWIIAHQELLQATSRFGQIISPYLFLEFIYIMIHTCVPAFVITSTFSWTVAQKMAVFFIVGGGILQLLLMSIAGDAFTQEWENIDVALFHPNLYWREEKRTFHFFMMVRERLKLPFRLRAFKIFPLSCATFATISRLIVSHYMTLNQIQTLKSGKV